METLGYFQSGDDVIVALLPVLHF